MYRKQVEPQLIVQNEDSGNEQKQMFALKKTLFKSEDETPNKDLLGSSENAKVGPSNGRKIEMEAIDSMSERSASLNSNRLVNEESKQPVK